MHGEASTKLVPFDPRSLVLHILLIISEVSLIYRSSYVLFRGVRAVRTHAMICKFTQMVCVLRCYIKYASPDRGFLGRLSQTFHAIEYDS